MASNLRVDQILPSTSTNVAIGTANGSVTLVGSVSGTSITNSGVTTVAAGSTSAPSITPTGDSNTGIFFPSADTIAFTEGGVEAARFDSNGNLGIGTANPPDKLTILGKIQVQQDASSNNRLVLRGQPGSSYRWSIDNYSSSNDFRIFREDDATSASGAVAVSISSTRNVTLSSGNLVFSTAGTGIDFSATSNSSGTMTSELLADYEEGTFTPTITGSSSNPTPTYNSTFTWGYYTKIGNCVYVTIEVRTSAISGGSGELRIAGLPFTASAVNSGVLCWETSVAMYNITFNTSYVYSGEIGGNTTFVIIRGSQSAGTGGNLQISDWNNSNPALIRINGFYYT